MPEIWADVYLALLDRLEEVDFAISGPTPYLRRRRKLALAVRRWAFSAMPIRGPLREGRSGPPSV